MLTPPHLRTLLSSALAVVLVLALGSLPAHAQSNGDGSIYSQFGVGTLMDFSSSRSAAMGGGGYALRSLNYNPSANPALWSDQVFTRLSAGGSFQRIEATGQGDQASRLSSGMIEALKFSFPLYERTLGVGFTFQPYSQHNHRLRREGTLQTGSGSEPFETNLRGKGGLHTFRGGLGYRVNDLVSVGASVDVLFGIVQNERSTEFRDATFRDLTLSDDTRLLGVTGTFGGHFSFADVLQSEDNLSLGASVTLPTTLSGTRVLTTGEGRDLEPDTLASPQEGEVSFPWQGRLGAAYQPNAQWTLTVDGLYEPWSTFSSTFDQTPPFSRNFPEGGEQTLADRWRVSIGAEVVPAGGDNLAGFFGSTAYRLGLFTERLYVRPDGTTNLQTYAATAGFSFPTSLTGTRIDINLTAGTRGTTENDLVRDTFYGVALHINFGERWFQKRRLR
jgi:hypothetical protein